MTCYPIPTAEMHQEAVSNIMDALLLREVEIVRLTAKLEVANRLLGKATEFRGGEYRVVSRSGEWEAINIRTGIWLTNNSGGFTWPTAAEAVAAVEKTSAVKQSSGVAAREGKEEL
jgi:hypothetical protein